VYDGLHKRNKNKLLLILPFMKFPFYGFIRIGIGIAIGIGCFTTGHILGFHGFWFQGFKVSGFQVSRFHPNRGRYRYRYRDRSFNHEHTGWHCSGFHPQIYTDYADFLGIARVFWERQREFLIFMKFHVFQGFIQIGVGVGIAIGIDCLTRGHKNTRKVMALFHTKRAA